MQTRASVLSGRRLTSWYMARPTVIVALNKFYTIAIETILFNYLFIIYLSTLLVAQIDVYGVEWLTKIRTERGTEGTSPDLI
jgi:hypothetical protein